MSDTPFSGNLIIFHCFDVGEDIDLEGVKTTQLVARRQPSYSRYFKNYHTPLTVDLPYPEHSAQCENAKLHSFGVITLRYKIPFYSTLEDLRAHISALDNQYEEQSLSDAQALFKRIKSVIKHPRFYHMRKSYMLVQINPHGNPEREALDPVTFKETYGNTIASILRFETESLSEHTKNEILQAAHGYYRGDLVVIDTEASFMYNDEYEDVLDIFEFANMQHLELQFFDRTLDIRLNEVYSSEVTAYPFKAYLPFWSSLADDPVNNLNKLRVEILVITERLESSIKLAGEPYYLELFQLLSKKLDLANWKESLHNKLTIIQDMTSVYQEKIYVIRQDVFSVLIIILIFMEFIVGILHYLQK